MHTSQIYSKTFYYSLINENHDIVQGFYDSKQHSAFFLKKKNFLPLKIDCIQVKFVAKLFIIHLLMKIMKLFKVFMIVQIFFYRERHF